MCARYSLYTPLNRLIAKFQLENNINFEASYNRPPSTSAPIIIQNRIGMAKWGLCPPWAQGKKINHPHNARIETAADKPMFRHAWDKHRCLVPADGFYEWQDTPEGKQPIYFHYQGEPFAFAGLWEKAGDEVTFTILTQAASGPVARIHDRMPVILSPDMYPEWLEGGFDIANGSRNFMQNINSREVTRDVNKTGNNYPELIKNSA